MLKKRLILVIILTLIAAVGPLHLADSGIKPAQAGGSWSAWLVEYSTGRMIHVFPDGAAPVEMVFPLPPGTSSQPYEMAISPDGAYVAACLTDDTGSSSVRVYDIYGGSYIAAYIPAGPIMGCWLSRYAFSEDSSQLAVGIINHYAGMSDSRPAWELVVMQMHTSAILHHLDSFSPALASVGDTYEGFMPAVSTFQMATGGFPGLITFKPIQWGTEGACEYDSMIWNLTDGSVVRGGSYGKDSLDILWPNSELTWVETDPVLPQGSREGPGCTHNIVMYSNKAGDYYGLFTNGTVLSASSFVDDGRKIAFRSEYGGASQWMALDRGGAVTMLPPDLSNAYAVWGTLDGYVFVTNPVTVDTIPEVRYHRFSGGPSPEVYVAWTGLAGQYYRMIWVNQLSGGNGLSPFPALSTTGTPPLPVPTATVPGLPPAAAVLMVGGRATTFTTGGDPLRVRTGSGTTFAVAFQLPSGSPVTLMEGPVNADGLVWWRVQTADGRSGWCIEGIVDGGVYIQTLVPAP